jgi:hypothetical protein
LVLSDLTTKDLLDLVSRVNEAHSAEDALAVFDGGSLTHDRVAKRVKAGVEAAQSLTDRYALILYWVLRKRGARDFSYAANSCSIGTDASSGSEPPEPLLNDSARPEKQHLVPYALLKRLFGVTGARPGRHETHDIGNLTYISAFQNGFDGVASTPLNVAAEPANNRDAHFLHDPLVIATFVKVCDSMKQGGDSSDQAKAYYRRFCAVRKGAIADAVIAWDAEARDTVPVGTPDLIPPQVRLIAPTLEDRLRQLAYPLPVINALIDLSRAGLREAQGKDLAIRLSLKRRGKGQPQLLRIDLPLAGAQVRLKVADPEFQRQFSRHFPAIPAKLSKGALRCTLSTTSRADIAQAVAALEWVLPLTGAARESVQ